METGAREQDRRGWRDLWGAFRARLAPGTPVPAGDGYPWEKSYPQGIDWHATIIPVPIPEMFDRAAAAYGDHTCLSFRGRRTSYRETADQVNRAAKGLQGLGVGKGIKVGLALPNSPYAVIFFHAVLKAGGTVVNLNPLYGSEEIARQIADSGACVLITLNVKALYDKISRAIDAMERLEKIVICPIGGVLPFHERVLFDLLKRGEVADIPDDDRHVRFNDLLANDGKVAPVDLDAMSDVAVFQYTGGTTGTPKAARLTHANLFANTTQVEMWAPGIRPGKEKILGVLPLFHAFGMTVVMNFGLKAGAELILLPNFNAGEVLQTISRDRPTIFTGVPTMYSALSSAFDADKHDLSSLAICISGGAPLPAEVQRRFEEISGARLVEGYGLSEVGPVCAVNPLEGVNKAGSVGLPLPGTIIEIVSLDDPGRLLPRGEQGEICIRGPQVMVGYANRAEENVNAFSGGRFRTGDVGYLDEDGYLFIVDRIKEMILCGGFNVYPRMVEEEIYRCPAVQEAAVIGVPDSHMGEIVKAFVILKEGEELTAAQLRDFLKDKLAPFQMPRKVEFRASLPLTPIGKVSKKDLIGEEAKSAADKGPPPESETQAAQNEGN